MANLLLEKLCFLFRKKGGAGIAKIKKMPLFLVLVLFFFSLFYLHQKVLIHAAAFQLSRKYSRYQELISQKDYLRYNFSKKTSLSYVSNWFSDQDFSAPERERLLVFRPGAETEIQVARESSFLERFRVPTSISEVFAR